MTFRGLARGWLAATPLHSLSLPSELAFPYRYDKSIDNLYREALLTKDVQTQHFVAFSTSRS